MDLTTCPECGNAAEIQWRDVLESTDGPVEHAKLICVARHSFLLPVSAIAAPRRPLPWDTSRGHTRASR